ncbi:MAG TPA: DUF1569 domain-containing protein [Candidatus Hydrogenedentes bacterium]|nr:DUF1569 domain-containing protein [Candidatus Hydrogenedentota bacterium]
MRHLDADYVEELIARIRGIPDDAVPRWGVLRKQTLIEHLVWTVRHSMGRSTKIPFLGNWFTRRVVAPLILRGILPIPRNLQLPRRLRARGLTLREPGDLETLHALLDEYLNLVQADELRPARHPVFGDIGLDGWERLHLRHFAHHLRQFDA